MELSELLPGLAGVADDISPDPLDADRREQPRPVDQCAEHRPDHGGPAGRSAPGSPTRLGPRAQNLPAYCVLTDPGGVPVLGVDNWSNGWLPSLYQGTVIRPSEPRIPNLDPPPHLQGQVQAPLPGLPRPAQPRAPRASIPASSTWRRGSPATSWPRACRPPPRRRSTSPARAAATAEALRPRRPGVRASSAPAA